jgi:hypothetical protein
VVPALRIPGGGSRRSDCLLETAVDIESPALDGDGTPTNRQTCVDNDPGCDFDPAAGSCQFRVWLCFGGGDPRIECAADSVASIELKKPGTRDKGDLALLRQTLLDRLGALALPLSAGERCTQHVGVTVPAGRKDAKLSLKVRNSLGTRDSDTIKLRCQASAP